MLFAYSTLGSLCFYFRILVGLQSGRHHQILDNLGPCLSGYCQTRHHDVRYVT